MITEQLPVISDDPAIQAFYEDCRERGESHNMAKIFATRRTPAVSSDRAFHQHAETIGQQFCKRPLELAILKAKAKKMGFAVSSNDSYQAALGVEPLDPLAVVPHDNPKGHIRKVCRQRGMPCHGLVEMEGVVKDPKPDTGPPLAEDVIRKLMWLRIKKNPGLKSSKAKLKKLREDVINKHSPPK
jgi:hypothetical protein